MHLSLTWTEISIRLLCTLIAGASIGANRSEHGRPAGLRTSMLVSLAACIAMLQVNLLLPLSGRSSDQEGRLFIVTGTPGLDEDEIRGILQDGGFRISACEFAETKGADLREFNCKLHWRAKPYDTKIPDAVRSLTARAGVVRINWAPQAR